MLMYFYWSQLVAGLNVQDYLVPKRQSTNYCCWVRMLTMTTLLFICFTNYILTHLLYPYIIMLKYFYWSQLVSLLGFQDWLWWKWQSAKRCDVVLRMLLISILLNTLLTSHTLTHLLTLYKKMLMYLYSCQLVIRLGFQDRLGWKRQSPNSRYDVRKLRMSTLFLIWFTNYIYSHTFDSLSIL